jgi:hypothetical protein
VSSFIALCISICLSGSLFLFLATSKMVLDHFVL